MNNNVIKNIIKHFITITKHKIKVFKLCIKAGIPFRGLVHDLSKYSITEFGESIKYYQGTRSPIQYCREVNGYSKAWLHHKGRNKHHHEYWYDYGAPDPTPVIPYKYVVEMICDNLAAGQTYQGNKWDKEYQLKYWNRTKDKVKLNKKIYDLLQEVFEEISEHGIDKVINSKNLKRLYNKHVN